MWHFLRLSLSSPSGVNVRPPYRRHTVMTDRIPRRRYRLVWSDHLCLRKCLRFSEQLSLTMSTGIRNAELHNPSHESNEQLLNHSAHHCRDCDNDHADPYDIQPIPHHYRRHRFRLRSWLYPSARLLLDPRRRRPKLPQVPADFTAERLSRPRHPRRQQVRWPIQPSGRPACRADR